MEIRNRDVETYKNATRTAANIGVGVFFAQMAHVFVSSKGITLHDTKPFVKDFL